MLLFFNYIKRAYEKDSINKKIFLLFIQKLKNFADINSNKKSVISDNFFVNLKLLLMRNSRNSGKYSTYDFK